MKQTQSGISVDISCDVCRDLIPLVADGVASADSEALVEHHTARCQECRAYLESGRSCPAGASPDDWKIIRRLRLRLTVRAALFMLAGLLVSVLVRYSIYRSWWMPVVGAAGYFLLRRHWWIVPLGVGALDFLWQAASILRGWDAYGGSFPVVDLLSTVLQDLYSAGVTVLLVALGMAVAALLRFALGGLSWNRIRKGSKDHEDEEKTPAHPAE